MRAILAAGGSGGHIFPAVALAEELRKKGVEDIFCVASRRRLDRNILGGTPYRCFFLSANPLPREVNPFKLIVFIFKFIYDAFYSITVLLRVRPSVVVGFGGYASGAISVVSKIFGIPLVIHEQNFAPGRANRVLSRIADRIALSFEGSKEYFVKAAARTVFTGNPLRTETLTTDRTASSVRLGINPDKFTVLAMGGSQGASFLNRTFGMAAERLSRKKKGDVQFIHLTGSRDYREVSGFYRDKGIPGKVFSFLDRIEDAYAASDLAVSRSGAAAVFELAYYAKPMILVPYPNPKNNQWTNARFFSDAGAAIYREEKALTADNLYKDVLSLIEDGSKREALSEAARGLKVGDSARKLAEAVIELAEGQNNKR